MPEQQTWHYEKMGDGNKPFIWLHGWGHDLTAFKRMAGLFNSCGHHTLYDQPGFGKTPTLPEGASTIDYANALATQLAGTKDNILIGHSYGGRVAIQMAANHPSLVKAIILVSGAGLKRKRSLNFKVRAFLLRTIGRLARLSDTLMNTNLRTAYVNRFGSRDYQNAGPLRATLVSAVNEDLSQTARKIKCPTLLIYGADDTETPPEIGKRYESLIPIARYEELSGYGHNDILTRGAYQCEALIKRFLKNLGDV